MLSLRSGKALEWINNFYGYIQKFLNYLGPNMQPFLLSKASPIYFKFILKYGSDILKKGYVVKMETEILTEEQYKILSKKIIDTILSITLIAL